MTRWQYAGLGWIAGLIVATCACLAAIAHETYTREHR